MLKQIALAMVLGSSVPATAMACDRETSCEVAGGDYLIALPLGNASGALVFLHGWGGSAEGTMRNAALVDAVLARGYAFVAANGMPRGNGNAGRNWSFHPDFPAARDEGAYFAAVFDDLAARHGVDRDRIIMGGFSAGGFMTTYLACADPDIASAFVPVSGGFWRPDPVACDGPVRLFHTHGWTDTVVPLEGRYLRNGEVAQGDIFKGMEIWRQTNGCDAMRADQFDIGDGFWRRSWDRCLPGSALEFALFPGGHTVPSGWADMMFDWYEALPVSVAH